MTIPAQSGQLSLARPPQMLRCRCGGAIFARSVPVYREEPGEEWAHADPFDSHDTTRCEDGGTAEPVGEL